jgi:hypothetical protein
MMMERALSNSSQQLAINFSFLFAEPFETLTGGIYSDRCLLAKVIGDWSLSLEAHWVQGVQKGTVGLSFRRRFPGRLSGVRADQVIPTGEEIGQA